jgi:fructose/tagatose bisphosphate aldolase/uncharacterized protein YgbK (DUF1537 family)
MHGEDFSSYPQKKKKKKSGSTQATARAVLTAPPAPSTVAAPPPIFATLAALEASVPPALGPMVELNLRMRAGVLAGRRGCPLAVVDDDPTGTQSVHGVPVLADWSVPTLAAALAEDVPCFYVLANTRALSPDAAAARAGEIGANLRLAAGSLGLDPLTQLAVVSRGDSTLRGHYPLETDSLAAGLGWHEPATLLAPFFLEGGRLTAHDVHYVATAPSAVSLASASDLVLTPAGGTEFAKDKAFGYAASHLPSWVEEKTGGRVPAKDVATLSLATIRGPDGPAAVAQQLACLPRGGRGAVVVANALDAADMAVVGLGCLRAQAMDRHQVLAGGLLFRSAGSLVAALAAVPPRPLLTAAELQRTTGGAGTATKVGAGVAAEVGAGGLVVVGSYVGKSSSQLAALRRLCPWAEPVELNVAALLAEPAPSPSMPPGAGDEVARVRAAVRGHLRRGASVALFTSRAVAQDDGAAKGLASGALVSQALVDVVKSVVEGAVEPGDGADAEEADGVPPLAFLVAKGGITSNDVAVEALGVTRAEVLGCVVPGVPAWRLGPDSRAPGLAYVVFPGNVGGDDDLARAVALVSGRPLVETETATGATEVATAPQPLFLDPAQGNEFAGGRDGASGKKRWRNRGVRIGCEDQRSECEWEQHSDDEWEGNTVDGDDADALDDGADLKATTLVFGGDEDDDDGVNALLAELRELSAKSREEERPADGTRDGAGGADDRAEGRVVNLVTTSKQRDHGRSRGASEAEAEAEAAPRPSPSVRVAGDFVSGLTFDGTVSDLLREARGHGRAVGAFNVYNLEGCLAVADAARRCGGFPALVQVHPASLAFGGGALLAACLAVSAAAPSPLLVQLDHATEEADVATALAAGVHGVMVDGSHLSLGDNALWTGRMASKAHGEDHDFFDVAFAQGRKHPDGGGRWCKVSVEAELGRLAGEEDGLAVALREARMTDPASVGAFLEATKVDCLAVTIGNVHGPYARDPPDELDWARLDAVRLAARLHASSSQPGGGVSGGDGVPLVLHGASGLPPAMVRRAIQGGVAKFNVNTEVRAAALAATRRQLLPPAAGPSSQSPGQHAEPDVLDCMVAARKAMAAVIEEKMRLFTGNDK